MYVFKPGIVTRICVVCEKEFSYARVPKATPRRKCCSPECVNQAVNYGPSQSSKRKKLSQIAKDRNLGGYKEGSGRGKKGRYKGFWCDSSYELAWIIYHLEHGIEFTRNTQKFPYVFDGKTHYWIPDFIMSDGSYVEIKGYETAQSKAKIAGFNHPVVLLKEKDLQHVFSYVIDKYGRDFTSLYG